MTKIRLLKIIDAVFGRFLCFIFPRASRTGPAAVSPKHILFMRPGGIGDAVLLIPTLNALKKAFPDIELHILAEKRNAEIFTLFRYVYKIYRYDNIKELIAALRERFDMVIDTEQWHRLSTVVGRLTGAPMLIGYATNERKKLFTHPIPYSHDDYEVRSFLNLLSPLGMDMHPVPEAPFLSISKEVTDKIGPVLKTLSNRKIIAIFPGGSIREKKWGAGKFRQVAKKLIEKKYGIVIVGGKDDVLESNEISKGLTGLLNLCGKLSLAESAAVLNEVSLLITSDSGIMHIAYGLGTRIIVLFGPGNTKKWAPKSEGTAVISKNLDCSPCSIFGYTPRCAYNAACMRQITVDEVYARALELLER